ncbi:hypothetical protein ACP70R_048851 [Stipagrostis hirtigluma subsp. patula]
MEPSDCESCTHVHDVAMEELQERPSHKKVDIDRAIDLMRFAFREGMAFLDNGSGRSFEERMIVDMSEFMVNMLFQGPGVPQRDGPRRMRAITPTIDKDIAHAFVKETRKGVAKELQGDLFGIVLDVCSSPSTFKKYMVLFVRYVNVKGEVVERLLGIVPEPDVYDSGIKAPVDLMLSEAGLSLANVRGQGYGLARYGDEIFTQLKKSVAEASASAYCMHPNAFKLQSTLASASQDRVETYQLFQAVDLLSDLIQGSPQFREKLCSLIKERGLNLDSDIKKQDETCWGSYYEALVKLAACLDPVCDALIFMAEHASRTNEKHMALKVQWAITDDFPFGLLLMRDVLGATNELSLALDRNDLDSKNRMALLQESKKQLLIMRDEGWPSFLKEVNLLCSESDMPMPDLGENFKPRVRLSDEESRTVTNLEHYHIDYFIKVINKQLEELDKRFSKESLELVCLASCLNPRNSFQAFDKDKLIEFARFYPTEFSDTAIGALDLQLQVFIKDVRSDARFHEISALRDLSVKMVETGKNVMYPLVYLLLKLALILPGTAATAKTASSAMKFIDSTMVKEPCNQWISDCLLLYLERDIFESVTNDAVVASLAG